MGGGIKHSQPQEESEENNAGSRVQRVDSSDLVLLKVKEKTKEKEKKKKKTWECPYILLKCSVLPNGFSVS